MITLDDPTAFRGLYLPRFLSRSLLPLATFCSARDRLILPVGRGISLFARGSIHQRTKPCLLSILAHSPVEYTCYISVAGY